MDPTRFDAFTRLFASPRHSRRALLSAAAGFLASAAGHGAGAQSSQLSCANVSCKNNPGKCGLGCVCCVYGNGNTRCMAPGACSGTPTCPTGLVPGPSGCAAPTTTTTSTTAAPTTTTSPPTTTTPAPTTTTTTTTTPAPTTTTTTTSAPTTTTTTTAPPVCGQIPGTCPSGCFCTKNAVTNAYSCIVLPRTGSLRGCASVDPCEGSEVCDTLFQQCVTACPAGG